MTKPADVVLMLSSHWLLTVSRLSGISHHCTTAQFALLYSHRQLLLLTEISENHSEFAQTGADRMLSDHSHVNQKSTLSSRIYFGVRRKCLPVMRSMLKTVCTAMNASNLEKKKLENIVDVQNLCFPLTADEWMVKVVIALASFGVTVGVILLGLTLRRTGKFILRLVYMCVCVCVKYMHFTILEYKLLIHNIQVTLIKQQ